MKHHDNPRWWKAARAAAAILLVFGSTSTMAAKKGDPPADEPARIAATLDLLHASAAKADGTTYFGLFTPDAVFIGTDVAERWSIAEFRAYAEPGFAKGTGWVYTVRHRELTIAPIACRCVAWFDEVLDSQKYGTSRGTGVLMRTPAGWKIAQYALTFPMPNDLAAEFTQRIREHEKKAGK